VILTVELRGAKACCTQGVGVVAVTTPPNTG
jgi:hypothetical protein